MPTSPNSLHLDHATPRTATDSNPEAESLLLSEGPGKPFRLLYPKVRDAAHFYALFFVHRFAPSAAGGVCKDCHIRTPDLVAVRWQAVIGPDPNKRFTVESTRLNTWFDTHHSLCPECLAAARARLRRYRLGITSGIGLALLAVAYMMWSAYSPAWAVSLKSHLGNSFYAPPAVLMLAGIALIILRQRDRSGLLPPDLRNTVPGAMFHSLRHAPRS